MVYDARMSQEVIHRTTALVEQFDARVQAADPGSWANQSPCTEWKARDVVAHVAGTLNWIHGELADAEPTASASAAADDDVVGAWNMTRDRFLTALSTGDLSKTIESPFGAMPAEQMIGRIICADVLIHTWDLARAVGGDEQLDAAAVEGTLSGLQPMDAMLRSPGVMGPKLDAPEGADTQTALLAFVGRQA